MLIANAPSPPLLGERNKRFLIGLPGGEAPKEGSSSRWDA